MGLPMGNPLGAHCGGGKILPLLIPDIAGANGVPAAEEGAHRRRGIGQHGLPRLGKVTEEAGAVEGLEAQPVEHQMIVGGVGKAGEDLRRLPHLGEERRVLHQVWQQPVGIVAADGREDAPDGRVEKGGFQVLGPVVRAVVQNFRAVQRMGHEHRLQAKVPQALRAQNHAVGVLPQHTAGQADNGHPVPSPQRRRADQMLHKTSLLCFIVAKEGLFRQAATRLRRSRYTAATAPVSST